VALFRRIRQRHSSDQVLPIIQSPSQLRTNETSGNTTTTSSTMHTKKKKKTRMLFPWWSLFIVYGLSYLLIGICVLLIIARGIEFGDTKVEKWLTSMISGFFSSILLSQPIKVCLYEILLMNSLGSLH
jgi:hypothetical protein